MRINSKNIDFVLVEPQVPGNIGAAARAMKTMDFHNLILVNPADHTAPESKWMAHASNDVLDNAKVYSNFKDAIGGSHFVVATTQRNRSFHLPYFVPHELARRLVETSILHKVSIVFGREQSGLTNSEIALCHAVSTVPTNTTHPSLNLAQAVMIYSYEFYQIAYGDVKKYNWKLANQQDLESLYSHLQKSLQKVGFVPIDSWENFLVRFSRLLGRANTEVRDVKVWHKILKSFEQHILQLEKKLAKYNQNNEV